VAPICPFDLFPFAAIPNPPIPVFFGLSAVTSSLHKPPELGAGHRVAVNVEIRQVHLALRRLPTEEILTHLLSQPFSSGLGGAHQKFAGRDQDHLLAVLLPNNGFWQPPGRPSGDKLNQPLARRLGHSLRCQQALGHPLQPTPQLCNILFADSIIYVKNSLQVKGHIVLVLGDEDDRFAEGVSQTQFVKDVGVATGHVGHDETSPLDILANGTAHDVVDVKLFVSPQNPEAQLLPGGFDALVVDFVKF